jgi:uncharacterized protein DUF3105
MPPKKKPRTPTPPRVQAPQRRSGPSRTSGKSDDLGMQHRKYLYLAAAGGFVGLIVVVLLIVFAGGSGSNEKALAADFAAAGCTFKTVDAYVPKGQSTHVTSLTKKLPWNTDPPSNGQHYPEWAVWDWYTEPVNPRQVVHNEEHGGVIEWWGSDVPAATVSQLHAFYLEHPDGGFGTPYPSLGSKIALTAWTGDTSRYQQNGYYGQGHIAVCPSFTAKTKTAFEAFRKAYIGKGPEGIPLSADEPGMGPTTQ